MKTLEEILNQETVYLHDWKEKKDVVKDFHDTYFWDDSSELDKVVELWSPINILFASYSYENYSGDAWVLIEKNGELFEVNGSHCSCYGLEGQWEEEKVSLTDLEYRLLNGTFGEDDWCGNEFKKELCDFLGVEYKRNSRGW